MPEQNEFTPAKVLKEVLEADRRIHGLIRETSVEQSYFFSELGDCQVYLKLENTQITGSFKLRGAFNRLLTLSKKQQEKGIITASSGNHAAAVTYALGKLGLKGQVYIPENISLAKLDVLRTCNADLVFHGQDMADTEVYARKIAEENEQSYVSPYNDAKIIGGQGTIGAELMRQLDKIDAVFVPVGGGGLIAGIAGYLKSLNKEIEIIGCQPQQSPVMYESVKAGRIIQMKSGPTLADGTAGGIDEDSITFNICKTCVDEFVLVSEDQIKTAVKLVLQGFHMLVEGAAALSVAAFIKIKKRFIGKNVILVLSGKKISFDILKKIIC